MGLFKLRELTIAEKIAALEAAKNPLRLQIKHGVVSPLHVRPAMSDALADCGFFFGTTVGGKREVSVTLEIGRALGLGEGVESVVAWAKGKKAEDLIAALDKTMEYLQRLDGSNQLVRPAC